MDGSLDNGLPPPELENDSVGSSKETVCGPLVCISLPWRCFGAEGFGLVVFESEAVTRCCRSSSEIDVS